VQPCSARERAVSNPEKKQNSNCMLNRHITDTTETLILLYAEDNCLCGCDGLQSGRLLSLFSRNVLIQGSQAILLLSQSEDGDSSVFQNIDNNVPQHAALYSKSYHFQNLKSHIVN
jgi:hypothetical protein